MGDHLLHKFVTAKLNGADTTLLRPSNWNEEHIFHGGATGQVLGWDATSSDQVKWAFASAEFDVKNYGAVGDGVTDDTAAIQAAIDAATLVRGTVFLPRGTYRITASLDCSIRDYMTIYGQGRLGVTTIVADFNDDHPIFDLVGSNWWTIRTLQIRPATGKTPSCGILMGRHAPGTSGGNHVIDQVTIYGDYRVANVYTIASEDNLWSKCWFWSAVGDTTPHALLYTANTAANVYGADVSSPHTSLTYAGLGSSANIYRDCSFWYFANHPTGTVGYLQTTIETLFCGCDVYTAGPTAQFTLHYHATNLSFDTMHLEYSGTQPYFIDLVHYAAFSLSVVNTNLLPIHGIDNSVAILRLQSCYWHGTDGVGTVVLDMAKLRDSWIDVSESQVSGSYITDGVYRVRQESTRNVFRNVPTAQIDLSTATVIYPPEYLDPDTITVDVTNHRMGINTAAPQARLEVTGGIAAGMNEVAWFSGGDDAYDSGPVITFRNGFGNNAYYRLWKMGHVGATYYSTRPDGEGTLACALVFYTNSGASMSDVSEKMRLTGSGRLILTGANGQTDTRARKPVLSGAMSGATLTFSSAVPAGSEVHGLTIHPTTPITSGDGGTTYTVTDSAVAPHTYGTTVAFASDVTLATAGGLTAPFITPTALDIILTCDGGKTFSAGAVRLTVHYTTLGAATS